MQLDGTDIFGLGTMFVISFALLTIAGTIFAAYPYNPYPVGPAPHVQQLPPYLVYPQGVYKLTDNTNNTYQVVNGHDFIFGAKRPQDQLLLHTRVYKRPGIWSNYVSKEITFPPPGSPMRVNITQVNAYDRGRNGTGGFVKLVRGGIGSENVTLVFRSQKNLPINYEVDIYGQAKR